MIKSTKEILTLPFEVGKTYKTKFATGDLFKLTKIIEKDFKIEGKTIKRIIGFEGVYDKHPHLGECPLAPDRLIPEYMETENIIQICSKCKTPLHNEDENKLYR